jgi:hypothetical protein
MRMLILTKRATGQIEKDAKVLNDLSVLMNSQNILAENAMKKADALKDKEFKDGLWTSYEAEAEYNSLLKEVNDIAQVYEGTYQAALKMDTDLKNNVNQIKKYEGDRAMMMATLTISLHLSLKALVREQEELYQVSMVLLMTHSLI